MNTHISCLPNEVLEYIFSYLSMYERLNIALVCKHWLKILESPLLLEDVVFQLKDSFIPAVPFHSRRRFPNFRFSRIHLSLEHLAFFIQYGDNIKELNLYECSLSDEIREAFYSHKLCRNLNSLKIKYPVVNLFPNLPKLKSFHIECRDEKDIKFIQGITMPNIEELSFCVNEWCIKPITDDFLPSIFQLKMKSNPVLLSFDRCVLAENHISQLIEMANCLQLKRIVLNINDSHWISDLLKAHNNITDLVISSEVDDDNVKLICAHLPALKTVDVISRFVDSSVIDIFRLKNLQSFSICSLCKVKKENFTKAFQVAEVYQLKTLKLKNCEIDDEQLRKFLIKLPHLRCLHLIDCIALSDDTVKTISKHLTGLRHLILSGCINITDAGIYSSCHPEECISNIRGLRNLELFWCKNITSTGLVSAIKFRELYNLGISNRIEYVVDSLKNQNPYLKYFMNI